MLNILLMMVDLLHAKPPDIEIEKKEKKIERFFQERGLEYQDIATNQRGWEGVSRGYHSAFLFEESDPEAAALRIAPTWNTWSLLPNLRIETADDIYRVLRKDRGGIFFPHFDLKLLSQCPPESGLKRSDHIYVEGKHTVTQKLFDCNPYVLFDLAEIERLEVPLNDTNKRWIKKVQVGEALDEQSVEHLRGYSGWLTIHAKRYPTWLKEGVVDARWSRLTLHGVRSLTVKQAKSLAVMSKRGLYLPDLEKISVAEAKALSGSGPLDLPKLKKISPAAMRQLTANRKWLRLGISDLPPNVMDAIQSVPKGKIELPNVTTLSRRSMQKIRPAMRKVQLGVLEDFDGEDLRTLTEHIKVGSRRYEQQRSVYFGIDQLKMSLYQAIIEKRKAQPKTTSWLGGFFYSAREIDADVMALALAEPFAWGNKDKLRLGVHRLSPETAQVMQDQLENIRLPKLESSAVDTLRILAQTEGELILDGMKVLSPEQAEVLAGGSMKSLSLKGLESTSTNAMRFLADYEGKLILPNWILYNKDSKPYLLNHGASMDVKQPNPDTFAQIQKLRASRFSLTRVESINAEQAAQIALFPGKSIKLVVHDLSVPVARALSKSQANLSLELHGTPEKGAITALAAKKNSLHISFYKSKAKPAAEELVALVRTFQGEALSLDGLEDLPILVAKAIVETKYTIYLETKTILEPAAKILEAHPERKIHLYVPKDRFCGTEHIENEYCIELWEMEQDEGSP